MLGNDGRLESFPDPTAILAGPEPPNVTLTPNFPRRGWHLCLLPALHSQHSFLFLHRFGITFSGLTSMSAADWKCQDSRLRRLRHNKSQYKIQRPSSGGSTQLQGSKRGEHAQMSTTPQKIHCQRNVWGPPGPARIAVGSGNDPKRPSLPSKCSGSS